VDDDDDDDDEVGGAYEVRIVFVSNVWE